MIRNIPELYAERDEKDLDLDEIKEDKQQFKFQTLAVPPGGYSGCYIVPGLTEVYCC